MENLLEDLRDTVSRVRGAVARAGHDAVVVSGSDAALLDTVTLAGELHRLAEALLIETTGEITRRSAVPDRTERLSSKMGCHNANELLQRLTRGAPATVARWTKAAKATGLVESLMGERLPAMLPAVRDAMLSGDAGLDGVLAIAGPLAEIRCRVGREELLLADETLASHATGAGPDGAPPMCADELKLHASAWAAALDQDGDEPTDTRATLRRGVTLGTARDGLVPIRGNLLVEVAAQLQRIIDACCSPYLPDHSSEDAIGEVPLSADSAGRSDDGEVVDSGGLRSRVQFRPTGGGDGNTEWGGNPGLLDDRTRAQKQHDALATALFAAASSQTLPTLGGAAPTLVVAVAEEDLEAGTGCAHIDGADTPVPLRVARHTACAGVIQRISLDRTGRIRRLGTEERVFNRHQRRAIALRDGGCVIPGCGVPAAWCEIHHVTEHARGGPTHTDNGVLPCWHHHRFIDTGPWQIRMNQGVPEVKAPRWFDPADRWRPVTKSRARILSLTGRRT